MKAPAGSRREPMSGRRQNRLRALDRRQPAGSRPLGPQRACAQPGPSAKVWQRVGVPCLLGRWRACFRPRRERRGHRGREPLRVPINRGDRDGQEIHRRSREPGRVIPRRRQRRRDACPVERSNAGWPDALREQRSLWDARIGAARDIEECNVDRQRCDGRGSQGIHRACEGCYERRAIRGRRGWRDGRFRRQ
ncbi:MAG: hypothetical protein QOE58_900 [Actinomycetota bacterium]|nr:hypothetical protein [Actinomycetota bacterium]